MTPDQILRAKADYELRVKKGDIARKQVDIEKAKALAIESVRWQISDEKNEQLLHPDAFFARNGLKRRFPQSYTLKRYCRYYEDGTFAEMKWVLIDDTTKEPLLTINDMKIIYTETQNDYEFDYERLISNTLTWSEIKNLLNIYSKRKFGEVVSHHDETIKSMIFDRMKDKTCLRYRYSV